MTADLEHRLATLGEVTSQTGAVVAGALDSPDTNAARMPLHKAQRVGVPTCTRPHDRLRHYRSRRGVHDRERVLIAVRVDTDHVIHLVCKHPDRSSVHS